MHLALPTMWVGNFHCWQTAELEEHTRKKDEICKERDALQAECQQLKHEMEKAEEKSLKIRDTSTAIQVKERPLRVSTLVCFFFLSAVQFGC